MTKSELIERIATRQAQLSTKDVELAIKCVIDQMVNGLAAGNRIEIRGFGSFSLHYRAARTGRNPKTGEQVHFQVSMSHILSRVKRCETVLMLVCTAFNRPILVLKRQRLF